MGNDYTPSLLALPINICDKLSRNFLFLLSTYHTECEGEGGQTDGHTKILVSNIGWWQQKKDTKIMISLLFKAGVLKWKDG